MKLNSVWTHRLTTQISGSYNNKGGAAEDTYNDWQGSGPQVEVYQSTVISGGRPTGTGSALVTMDNMQTQSIQPSWMWVFRGDVTYYRDGWAGSHEFKTGIWAAPVLARDVLSRTLNDGFILERRVQRDPNDPAAGLVPFYRRYETPAETLTTAARDRDYALYAQDSWKPNARMTANAGIRVDFVRRFDDIYQVERMNSTNVGPRLGLAYLLTKDARNVVRVFYGRLIEQVNGRDPITTYSPFAQPSQRQRVEQFDANGDGIFELTNTTPAGTPLTQRARLRSERPSAVRRRADARFREAIQGTDQRRSVGDAARVQGRLWRGRHQRLLSERTESAVRRLRQGRPEPRSGDAADQRDVDRRGRDRLRGGARQEHVAQRPGDRHRDAPVPARHRHVESDRRGAVHPAGRLSERPRSLAPSVRQRRRHQPRRRRARVGRRLPAATRCGWRGSIWRRWDCGLPGATSFSPAATSDRC